MPALFIIAITFLAIAVIAAIVAVLSPTTMRGEYGKDLHPRRYATLAAVALVGLAGLFTLFSSANTVPTRNVGIVTSFNKPTGEVTGAGLKWVAPWKKVEDWDASRQTFDHKHQNKCVQVRIVGLQGACVEVQVEWQTHTEKAPEQWASYRRDFEQFVGRRVDPNLTGALNDVFATHDPLANIDGTTGVVKPVDTTSLVDPLRTNVEKRIGADVKILGIVFGFVHYDAKTQEQIEAFQQKLLENRNLQQEKKNADVRKEISEKNAQVNPVTRCLEIAAQHGKEPGLCLGNGNPVQVTNK
jgi:hypothetical protein